MDEFYPGQYINPFAGDQFDPETEAASEAGDLARPADTQVTPDRVFAAYNSLMLAQELEGEAQINYQFAKQDYDAAVAAYTLSGLEGKNQAERDAHLYGLLAAERQALEEADRDLTMAKYAHRVAQTEVNMVQALAALGRERESIAADLDRIAGSLELLANCVIPNGDPLYASSLSVDTGMPV